MFPALCLMLASTDDLSHQFATPPNSARPNVYWYFMEGNLSREGMDADLASMRQAGLGGGIFLEVNIGIPKGPVRFMSPEWLNLVGHGVREAERQGLSIDMGTGPGWCGTGGPWVKPDEAMQHLTSAQIAVSGPTRFDGTLPQPKPRTPFFGMGSLTPELTNLWESFYRDEVVVAIPTPVGDAKILDLDGKSLVYRGSFSSQSGIQPYLRPDVAETPKNQVVPSRRVLDITSHLRPNGRLDWQVPAGKWTIIRFGRTLTGQTSRPAPDAGLGFETDKFDRQGITDHLNDFIDPIVRQTGSNRGAGVGLTSLHFDSWEMGSQNWSPKFRAEFKTRRGYDPLPYLPVMAGKIVDSAQLSERFLWDLRQTAQELVVTNHIGAIKERAKRYGLQLSLEPYDLNPTSDLVLGETADLPMGEFWSIGHGYRTEYSCTEAVSVGHTCGRPIIGAESFTADDSEAWLQNPSSMKAQTDWAFGAGINKIFFHRYQQQPKLDNFPGMTMGPYGIHWERTETWWDMVKPYHEYIARCQQMLRQGLPVADVLYLVPEGAPNVFVAPIGSTVGDLPDRRGYNFDACSPDRLMAAATAKDGKLILPNGMSYRLLVLPRVDTMTPKLLRKIKELVQNGLTVVGNLPIRSPSLNNYPRCDQEVQALARKLKGKLIPDPNTGDLVLNSDKTKWIWTDEGNARVGAPIGKRTFHRFFIVDRDLRKSSAIATFLGDNSFQISLNGHPVLSGSDFHKFEVADATRYLRTGSNELTATVNNNGDTPNPAGLFGNLAIQFGDGSQQNLPTNGSWNVDGHTTKELGSFDVGPWNLPESMLRVQSMYPTYETTAHILGDHLSAPPDIDCSDQLRYAHRRERDSDMYFLANRSDSEFIGRVKLRVGLGYPEWWNPLTGKSRPLPEFTRANGITTIPLRLDGLESGFVVFQARAETSPKPNFPTLQTVDRLDGPWNVSFDPQWGGPTSSLFDRLSDWTKNGDDGIRYYSGKATYSQSFDAPNTGSGPHVISLGDVKNLARVKLNGKDLGVAWCAPYKLDIPSGLLKSRGNTIEVEVANLWINRLIRDSGLPPARQLTRTTWNPYQPDSPLQPSGLLGPVRILR